MSRDVASAAPLVTLDKAALATAMGGQQTMIPKNPNRVPRTGFDVIESGKPRGPIGRERQQPRNEGSTLCKGPSGKLMHPEVCDRQPDL